MDRKGFAPIVILLIVAGVLAIGTAGYFYFHHTQMQAPIILPTPPATSPIPQQVDVPTREIPAPLAPSIPSSDQNIQPSQQTPTNGALQQPSEQPPPECVGYKASDTNLPPTCELWFSIPHPNPLLLHNQPPPGTITRPPQASNQNPPPGQAPSRSGTPISVKVTGASYKAVVSKPDPSGWFKTGQNADIALSAIDFNNTGGPLLFNHQGGIATDGQHLLLADRNNNRVLIWNELPIGNTPPDLVLGQKNFTTNNSGVGLDSLDWPVSVTTDGTHIFVADTYNDRILIWNSFPTQNGQPADMMLTNANSYPVNVKRQIVWPWAVWTNGKRLVVTSTGSSAVLIWNTLPGQSDQPADIVLTAASKFGTPRSIASDGTNLIIGDHNAKPNNNNAGNFFWKTFPTKDDQPYDFFIASINQGSQTPGEIFWGGTFTSDGKFIAIGEKLYIWNNFPQNATDLPSTVIGSSNPSDLNSYWFDGGDGSCLTLADNILYVSTSNGNKVVVYKHIPAVAATTKPDFAIGAPDIDTNTLETNFIMSNPIPATDGKSLFVSSDFDNKLYVYKQLPDQPGAHPDYVYPFGGWSNALYGNAFAEVNNQFIFIWTALPTNGQKPDDVIVGHIGNIQLQEVKGVAIDDKYFYLSDASANKVYIFEGIPIADSLPKYTLSVDQPYRLSSDGRYLVITTTLSNATGHVRIYRVDGLSNNAQPLWMLQNSQVATNLPENAIVSNNSLFIADTVFNRILVWKKITDAIAGTKPDIILGKDNLDDTKPEIGRNKAFWPAGVAFDGSFLWVGEFKFSERILRFSVQP